MAGRHRSVAVEINGPSITLADLRWLVDECLNLPDDSRVTVTGRRDYDERDFDPESIQVNGKGDVTPDDQR